MTRSAPRPSRALALALCLALPAILAACHKGADKAEEAPKAVAQVTTAVVAAASAPDTLRAYGMVEFAPGSERTLTSPAEAVVLRVLVGQGADVKQGQPVVLLGPSPQTRLDLLKAQQDAPTTGAAYARAQRLRASGLVSDAEVETARAAAATSAAVLSTVRGRMSGLTVHAPASGVIETLTAAPGDLVAQGVSLGRIGSLGAVRVRLGVEPEAASTLHAGQAVTLSPLRAAASVDAEGAALHGVIAAVDPRVDTQTRLASVVVKVAAAGLSPGEPVKGDILLAQAQGVSLPRAAVSYDADQPYVLVVQGGVAHRREVKLGARQGDTVLALSGIKPGERIVVEGGASLDDNAPVREAPPPEKDKADAKSETAKGDGA